MSYVVATWEVKENEIRRANLEIRTDHFVNSSTYLIFEGISWGNLSCFSLSLAQADYLVINKVNDELFDEDAVVDNF